MQNLPEWMLFKGIDKDRNEIAMHTHDRIAFKRCRRKWGFSSSFRAHLQPKELESKHLWFGTGIHFAMEDYHGYNRFGDPVLAFDAYVKAFDTNALPIGAEELIPIGFDMLDYYTKWLKRRNTYRTLWLPNEEGILVPQVEVQFSLELAELSEIAEFSVVYHGTIDKVVIDEDGKWWIVDYKTAAAIDVQKLATDPQISAYVWAAEQHYQHEIEGMLYLQMSKSPPQSPRILKNGSLSLAKDQRTTHAQFREALLKQFETPSQFPDKYVNYLNELAIQETIDGDRFIRWDRVRRNTAAKISTFESIVAEGKEMINPELYLYPNPTRDCIWDCSFRTVCLLMDEGGDWEAVLKEEFTERNETMKGEEESWRNRVKWPNQPQHNSPQEE